MGGNQGQVETTMRQAIQMIETTLGQVIQQSFIYATKAWGPIPQDDFLNQAVIIRTIFPPEFVLNTILNIEKKFGRKREVKYGPRTLDIDILFYGNLTVNKRHLSIPHPEIQNRKFALIPLNEMQANFVHPVLKKKVAQLLKDCKDDLEVIKV